MPGSFIDSNVLIYLASADPAKAGVAERMVMAGGTISVQVLNEVANVARRKMDLSWPETHELLSTLRGLLAVVPLDMEIHEAGLRLAERYRLSIWDSMIVAAALNAGCDTLWSEDMQHGVVLDGRLAISNPFRAA